MYLHHDKNRAFIIQDCTKLVNLMDLFFAIVISAVIGDQILGVLQIRKTKGAEYCSVKLSFVHNALCLAFFAFVKWAVKVSPSCSSAS